MVAYSKISKQDAISILQLIHLSLGCYTEKLFNELIEKLKGLVPFDFAICGMANLTSKSEITSLQFLNISCPREWLELYLSRRYDRIDPLVKNNFTNYKLQYWADTYRKYNVSEEFIRSAGNFGLNDGYTTGFRSERGFKGSIFSFSAGHLARSARTESILKTITPHFHQALARIMSGSDDKKVNPLSPREAEVLNWLKYGKTSWDISRILKISERTVNFHCSTIMQKLNAVSRSHALAIAIDKGLIMFD